jgi:pimeloyl-ACP methyl ester carboxylesterase
MGRSLGGTLATLATALRPEGTRGLILLGAPLCFEATTSRFVTPSRGWIRRDWQMPMLFRDPS